MAAAARGHPPSTWRGKKATPGAKRCFGARMSLPPCSSGLAQRPASIPGRVAAQAGEVLRGLGQVMFQNSHLAGMLFLAGIAANAPLLALGAVAGTLSATLTALALRLDAAQRRAGLFGFNGALVAVALLLFLAPTAPTWGCVILAAAGSTLVMAALQAAFDRGRLPPLTAPFVLVALTLLLAAGRLGRLEPSGLLQAADLPARATVEGAVTLATIGRGWLSGIGQVFFQDSVASGALFVLGLAVASRRAASMALAGSLTGLLVAWAMGAPEALIRSGAFGFNSVLTAIALGAVFLVPGRASAGYAIAGAAVAPVATAACATALAPLGLPAMTLPFVLVTWLFLLGARQSAHAGLARSGG